MSGAHMPIRHELVSREEIEMRLAALRSRVPSRRSDDTDADPQDDVAEAAADTVARLAALESRLPPGKDAT